MGFDGEEEKYEKLTARLVELRSARALWDAEKTLPPMLDIAQRHPLYALSKYAELQESTQVGQAIADGVRAFLDRKKLDLQRGKLSAGRFDTLTRCVDRFRDHAGAERLITAIDAGSLREYHAWLSSQIEEGNYSEEYAKTHMLVAKQFVKWCWLNEKLPTLPRNFDSDDLEIHVNTKAVPVFSVEEVIHLLDNVNETTKLYGPSHKKCPIGVDRK